MVYTQLGVVSIIVPTKNRHELLERTVRSLLVSPAVGEVIIVDDGSDEPVSLFDPRVLVLRHEQSKGEGAAVNAGWRVATSSHVMVVSDDDPQEPQLIPELLAAAARFPKAIAWYPQTKEVSEAGPLRVIPAISVTAHGILSRLRIPCLAGVLINAATLRQAGIEQLRDETVQYPNDTIQWLNLSLLGEFIPVSSATALWWRHAGQVSTNWPGERKAREYAENVGRWMLDHAEQVPSAAYGALFVRVLQCLPPTKLSSYLLAWQCTWPMARQRGIPLASFCAGLVASVFETLRYRFGHRSLDSR